MNEPRQVPPQPGDDSSLSNARAQFENALESLETVTRFARPAQLPRLLNATLRLLAQPGGVDVAYAQAHRFDDAGVFEGSDWDHPERLQPSLSRGSLSGAREAVAVESLSRLRMMAIAEGNHKHAAVDADAAREYLQRSLVMSLDLLQPDRTEAGRQQGAGLRHQAVEALLQFELDRIGGARVVAALVDEADRLLDQRLIDVSDARGMLDRIERLLVEHGGGGLDPDDDPDIAEAVEHGRFLLSAARGPTEASADGADGYLARLEGLDDAHRRTEYRKLGECMNATGLVCPAHAVLLRELADSGSLQDLTLVLGLDRVGEDCLAAFEPLARLLIRRAVWPETAQCIYGLSKLLEGGKLFFPPVPPALRRLAQLDMLPEVEAQLRAELGEGAPDGRSLLLAGVVSVLGLPLGVGQGNNPTCQSARAISLWSQCDPGYLLELIMWAARDGEIDQHFEGSLIRSSELTEGLIEDFHTDLDTVSLVLVPHLDKIYWEMGRRIAGRGEDGHRWINPEFHGWWVHRGFASTIDYATGAVNDFEGFIRRFHAAYHPDYNAAAELIYPQPAGIVATDAFGTFLGWHAIAIQRVDEDPDGRMRVYFYNPNNEGRQDWGQGIVTTTHGHGEQPGESSLPFDQFCARLYVFHFNERELGDPDAVPAADIGEIARMVRESWAADKPWHEVVTR
jgi:hypothetical protein